MKLCTHAAPGMCGSSITHAPSVRPRLRETQQWTTCQTLRRSATAMCRTLRRARMVVRAAARFSCPIALLGWLCRVRPGAATARTSLSAEMVAGYRGESVRWTAESIPSQAVVPNAPQLLGAAARVAMTSESTESSAATKNGAPGIDCWNAPKTCVMRMGPKMDDMPSAAPIVPCRRP